MKHSIIRNLMLSTLGLAVRSVPLAVGAEAHSNSKDMMVMNPRDLPEQAQLPSESFFLHSDNAGSTYLYVEQQEGSRLSAFDVTDPAHIKLASTTVLQIPGAFDFVQPIGEGAVLVHFRDGKGNAVIDLHKAKKPVLRMTAGELQTGHCIGCAELATATENIEPTHKKYQRRDISTYLSFPSARGCSTLEAIVSLGVVDLGALAVLRQKTAAGALLISD